MNQYSEYVGAAEAAELLGVKLPTIYAYASRGLIRSLPGGRGPARRYPRADVERLRARGAARRGGPPAAGAALRFGEPVLDSSITWLSDQGPVYRGRPALALALADTPFESVAELLWSGELPQNPPAWQPEGLGLPHAALERLVPADTPLLSALAVVAAALAPLDADRFDARPEAMRPRARRLVRRMVAALALARDPDRVAPALGARSTAESFAIATGVRADPAALRALDRALVLLADHGLNASTFAARVAASTRADLYSCFVAALATVAGPLHGAASQRVAAFVREVGRPERAESAIRERMRRGEQVPGFGHVVYPGGDPRTAPLLELAGALAPGATSVLTVQALVESMRAARRPAANVDTALVALGHALGMAPEVTPALFAIARTAGWTAHVLEQYEADFLIRPRARYLDAS